MNLRHRDLLRSIPAAAAGACAASPALAITPIARTGGPRFHLGLAAYSLRGHLTGKLTAYQQSEREVKP